MTQPIPDERETPLNENYKLTIAERSALFSQSGVINTLNLAFKQFTKES